MTHNALYNDSYDVRFDFSRAKPVLLTFNGLVIGEFDDLQPAIDDSHAYAAKRMESFVNSDLLLSAGVDIEEVENV